MFSTLAAILIAASFFLACEDDSFYTGKNASLRFSTDTVSFDTIFTTLGSATLNFRIYNRFDQPINIDNISLGKGDASNFRMNVDGYSGHSIDDVKIYAKDSAYVFVEVTVDATDENLPFIVDDSIAFTLNGNTQYVKLLAYGQNAYHIKYQEGDTNVVGNHPDSTLILVLGNTTFKNDKPYLIHDNVYIDEDATLTVEPGARIHFRKNKSLYVAGTLKVNGTLDEPVTFASDRWDDLYEGMSYEKVPGQWGYIHLLQTSKYNEINYANIRNSIIGIRADSVVTEDAPNLHIRNSTIQNCTSIGLYALSSHIVAENCVFANCGSVVVALTIGGTYDFTHCTIGNYYNWGGSSDPAVYISNFYVDDYDNVYPRDLVSADFKNCIIYGQNSDELMLVNTIDDQPVFADFEYSFDHCLIRTYEEIDTVSDYNFTNILWNKNPKFVDPLSTKTSDYRLDSLSAAINAGLLEYSESLPTDIDGNDRLSDAAPDLGAYERVVK